MTSTLPTIIFFGTEHSSLTSLKALVEAGYNIAAVVTKPDAPRGRGQKVTEPPVKTFATERGIEVWQPIKLRDIEQEIKSLQPAVGVLVSYGKIIPQSILDLFHPGIINLHPSLLPKWRGPSPIEAAIAARDRETGVSIMKLEAGMDSGPVYQQRALPLDGSETKQNLYTSLFDMGNQMLVDLLPDILSGKLQPVAQNHHDATY
ncbi:methionyl-tRNA formyltransferase, partial [Candidatus Saccharibacteria bacterium 32-50-10]